MTGPAPPKRNPRRGIVLIATMISLMLVVALASLLQAKALNNVRLVKRLELVQREDMVRDSTRELLRPLIADAMISFDADPVIRLNGTEFRTELDGYALSIRAQDVDGLLFNAKRA